MAHQAPNTVTGGSDHLFNKNGDREDVRTRREFEDGQPDLRGGARPERFFVGVIRCSDNEHGEDHFMPPFSLRDVLGYTVDLFLDPINWLVLPLIEIQGVPSAIVHKNRTTIFMIRLGRQAGEVTNDRSLNLEQFQGVEEATLDLYAAVRNAYVQKRAKAVRE